MRSALPLVALWLALTWASGPLRALYRPMVPTQTIVRREDALLELLGEGRSVLARLMWFSMDLMHEQLDDDGVDTFKQKEVVPLLRMITYLDPQITDAYDTLAFELFKGYGQTERAQQLVDEGLRFNPQSYQLLMRRGFLAQRAKDWQVATDAYIKALALAREEIDLHGALRSLYHCAVHTKDATLGLRTVTTMEQAGMDTRIYQAQKALWRKEYDSKPKK